MNSVFRCLFDNLLRVMSSIKIITDVLLNELLSEVTTSELPVLTSSQVLPELNPPAAPTNEVISLIDDKFMDGFITFPRGVKQVKKSKKRVSKRSSAAPAPPTSTAPTPQTAPVRRPHHTATDAATSVTVAEPVGPPHLLMALAPLLPINNLNDDMVKRYVGNRKHAFIEDIERDDRVLETLRQKQLMTPEISMNSLRAFSR